MQTNTQPRKWTSSDPQTTNNELYRPIPVASNKTYDQVNVNCNQMGFVHENNLYQTKSYNGYNFQRNNNPTQINTQPLVPTQYYNYHAKGVSNQYQTHITPSYPYFSQQYPLASNCYSQVQETIPNTSYNEGAQYISVNHYNQHYYQNVSQSHNSNSIQGPMKIIPHSTANVANYSQAPYYKQSISPNQNTYTTSNSYNSPTTITPSNSDTKAPTVTASINTSHHDTSPSSLLSSDDLINNDPLFDNMLDVEMNNLDILYDNDDDFINAYCELVNNIQVDNNKIGNNLSRTKSCPEQLIVQSVNSKKKELKISFASMVKKNFTKQNPIDFQGPKSNQNNRGISSHISKDQKTEINKKSNNPLDMKDLLNCEDLLNIDADGGQNDLLFNIDFDVSSIMNENLSEYSALDVPYKNDTEIIGNELLKDNQIKQSPSPLSSNLISSSSNQSQVEFIKNNNIYSQPSQSPTNSNSLLTSNYYDCSTYHMNNKHSNYISYNVPCQSPVITGQHFRTDLNIKNPSQSNSNQHNSCHSVEEPGITREASVDTNKIIESKCDDKQSKTLSLPENLSCDYNQVIETNNDEVETDKTDKSKTIAQKYGLDHKHNHYYSNNRKDRKTKGKTWFEKQNEYTSNEEITEKEGFQNDINDKQINEVSLMKNNRGNKLSEEALMKLPHLRQHRDFIKNLESNMGPRDYNSFRVSKMKTVSTNDKQDNSNMNKPRNFRNSNQSIDHNGLIVLNDGNCNINTNLNLNAGKEKTEKQDLFKTELCVNWSKSGSCSYGHKCNFAHGYEELQHRVRVGNYKTQPCCDPARSDSRLCLFGRRCNYAHPGELLRRAMSGYYRDRDYFEQLKRDYNEEFPFGIYV